jgi:Caspase domain
MDSDLAALGRRGGNMFKRMRWFVAGFLAAAAAAILPAAAEQRIALVIGNSAYERGAVRTALADAGLVAEALNGIGFEILEGADLNQADLRRTLRDFLARVEAAGQDAVAFVYFAGYGLEFEGETYLVPTDARLARDSDIPIEAVRMSDLIRPLAGTAALAKVVVLDAARPLPFTLPLAPGLAPLEAPPGMLVAYASAPGTYAEDGAEPYGAYASALAEMLREPGLDLDTIFAQARVRTHELTQARQTPWHVAALPPDIVLVPGGAPGESAPSVVTAPQGIAAPPAPRVVRRQQRPMREVDPEEAYGLAVEMDTLPGYVEYVETYPDSPYAPGMWSVIRSRREAMYWMRARDVDSPEAYWTYLDTYPGGIYAHDARRRLRRLAAVTDPPRGFAPMRFRDVGPPLAREPRDHVRVYAPVQRLPRNFIKPRPAYFSALPPPPAPRGPKLLPTPTGLPDSRLGPAPRRFGPPVGVVAPGTEQTPRTPGDRRFGTTAPPAVIQRDGSPSGRPGVKPLPSTTLPPAAVRTSPSGTPDTGAKPLPGRPGLPPGVVRTNPSNQPDQGLKPIPGRPSGPPPAAVRTAPSQEIRQIPGRPVTTTPAARVNPSVPADQGLKPLPGRPAGPPPSVRTSPPPQVLPQAPVVRSAPPPPPVVRSAPPPPPQVQRPSPPQIQVQRPVVAPPAATQSRQQPQQSQQSGPNKRCPIVNGQPKCS